MPSADNQPLPIQNPPVPRDQIVFSHPSEQEFAQVLDYYGVAWLYEPITFPLKWDEQGNILEAFSPDFYLVDQDIYVELTTLRPKLMRIKNRKMRALQELFPGIQCRLWRRSDFEYLLGRFDMQDRQADLVGKAALDD